MPPMLPVWAEFNAATLSTVGYHCGPGPIVSGEKVNDEEEVQLTSLLYIISSDECQSFKFKERFIVLRLKQDRVRFVIR